MCLGIRSSSKGRYIEKEALQPAHMLGLANITITHVLDTGISDGGGRHGILTGNSARIDHTREADELHSLVDSNLFFATYAQVAVVHDLKHRHGNGAGHGIAGLGSAAA